MDAQLGPLLPLEGVPVAVQAVVGQITGRRLQACWVACTQRMLWGAVVILWFGQLSADVLQAWTWHRLLHAMPCHAMPPVRCVMQRGQSQSVMRPAGQAGHKVVLVIQHITG